MTTRAMNPPNPTEQKPQSADIIQSTNVDKQVEKTDVSNVISTPSVFVNMEPMREDQVENAVKFLSHPKVRGSPVIYRRSFLEKKGLTKEEIDESFRRVPDPTPTVSSVQIDGQSKSLSNGQPQASTKALQPSVTAPIAAPMETSMLSQLHWSHAFAAVGFLAASGAGTAILLKNVVVPRLKSWICRVVVEEEDEANKKTISRPSIEEAAAAAAKAAAAAAADLAIASRELLNFKSEERKFFEELRNLLDMQMQEMKSMTKAMWHLEGQSNSTRRSLMVKDHNNVSFMGSKPIANGKIDSDLHPVRSSSPPAKMESAVAPHPKSYMDIMGMVQRGERPPNIMEINDLPPNPNQSLPNPRLAPRLKPWEVVGGANMNPSESWTGQLKNVRITEMESESGGEMKSGKRGSWVPPQAPPVAIPEAAAAIRHSKTLLPKQESAAEESVGDPPIEDDEGGDELQRITKISESGGVSEIQEEEE